MGSSNTNLRELRDDIRNLGFVINISEPLGNRPTDSYFISYRDELVFSIHMHSGITLFEGCWWSELTRNPTKILMYMREFLKRECVIRPIFILAWKNRQNLLIAQLPKEILLIILQYAFNTPIKRARMPLKPIFIRYVPHLKVLEN